MSAIAILDKTMCMQLVVTGWSGRRRLRPEDLGAAKDTLPPEDLASLGSLKLCDPKKLAELNRIRRQAERECQRVCVRFLGGYATDEDNISALTNRLLAKKTAFEKAAKAFAGNLRNEIDDWIKQHPQWKHIIEKSVPELGYVERRLTFNFQVFRVGAPDKSGSSKLNEGLNTATQGLSAELFKEIAQAANEIYSRSYLGRDVIGQRALRPIRGLLMKLEALRYLDKRIGPVIDRVSSVLASMPSSGDIDDRGVSALVGVLKLLSNPDEMREHGKVVLSGEIRDEEPVVIDTPLTLPPSPSPSPAPLQREPARRLGSTSSSARTPWFPRH